MRSGAARRFRLWFYLGQNRISMTGAVMTTSAAITLLVFWAYLIARGGAVHPYYSILFFLILPAFFVVGLVLMPIGMWRRRRDLRRRGELLHEYPRVDLGNAALRRLLLIIGGLTFVNFSILGTASYKGVEYMDSAQFCGQTCHTVMSPEFTAYGNSPHSRVACVECHIGPGAPFFVKAKIDGVRQVWAVAFNTYSRPIPSPVHDLRPARDTCEHCHWPQKFTNDRLIVRTKYAEDEANTPSTNVVLLKIGGRKREGLVGIHGRHLDVIERIEYVSTDGKRQVIPKVTYLDDSGKKVEYVSSDPPVSAAALAKGEVRKMDCIDCHNRPTHAFQMPDRALDEAMTAGDIARDLPFVKREALAALKTSYPGRNVASEEIPKRITEFYRTKYASAYQNRRSAIEAAAERVKAIYLRNIFPEMRLAWGTHPNNIGHEDFLGCFRCHDGKHKAADGRVINDDCGACHQVLAMEEKDPKILTDLGLK